MVKHEKNIILYNFNNIDDSDGNSLANSDLTYEFFEEQMDRDYELGGYDNLKPTRSELIRFIRMVKYSDIKQVSW